jgi:transcriptional regulator with XRE-family HTH domain
MAPARGIEVNGAAIRAIREAQGWGTSKFATALPLSTSHLSNVEAGRKVRVSPKVARRIADLLNVPLAAITSPHYVLDDVEVTA